MFDFWLLVDYAFYDQFKVAVELWVSQCNMFSVGDLVSFNTENYSIEKQWGNFTKVY